MAGETPQPPEPGRLTLSVEAPDGETGRRLIEAMCKELSLRYGTPPSSFSSADATAPRAAFLVARLGEEPVGCGAIRRLEEEVAEVKRMYVTPPARCQGVAQRILAELERLAVAYGYRTLRLETGRGQPEAMRLYERAGYHRIESFGGYAGNPVSVCYEKALLKKD